MPHPCIFTIQSVWIGDSWRFKIHVLLSSQNLFIFYGLMNTSFQSLAGYDRKVLRLFRVLSGLAMVCYITSSFLTDDLLGYNILGCPQFPLCTINVLLSSGYFYFWQYGFHCKCHFFLVRLCFNCSYLRSLFSLCLSSSCVWHMYMLFSQDLMCGFNVKSHLSSIHKLLAIIAFSLFWNAYQICYLNLLI